MPASLKTYVGACIMGGAICVGLGRGSNHLQARRAPTAEQAHSVYDEAAAREPEERLKAEAQFRSSPWSQDDDFHNKESKHIKEYAHSHHVSVGGVLDALDTGMRAHWETASNSAPNPTVMPCRPRLSY